MIFDRKTVIKKIYNGLEFQPHEIPFAAASFFPSRVIVQQICSEDSSRSPVEQLGACGKKEERGPVSRSRSGLTLNIPKAAPHIPKKRSPFAKRNLIESDCSDESSDDSRSRKFQGMEDPTPYEGKSSLRSAAGGKKKRVSFREELEDVAPLRSCEEEGSIAQHLEMMDLSSDSSSG